PSRGRPTQRLARQSCRREAVRRSRRIEESKGRGIEESRNRRSEESRNRGIEESRNRGIEESRNRGIEESRNRARRGTERLGSAFSPLLPFPHSPHRRFFVSEKTPIPKLRARQKRHLAATRTDEAALHRSYLLDGHEHIGVVRLQDIDDVGHLFSPRHHVDDGDAAVAALAFYFGDGIPFFAQGTRRLL